MFVNAISDGENRGRRIRQLNRSQGWTNFKVDLPKNQVSDGKMLYQIFSLFLNVESLTARLYHEFRPSIKTKEQDRFFEKQRLIEWLPRINETELRWELKVALAARVYSIRCAPQVFAYVTQLHG